MEKSLFFTGWSSCLKVEMEKSFMAEQKRILKRDWSQLFILIWELTMTQRQDTLPLIIIENFCSEN